jgi:alkanesulfonate monooxygenase SsuD/methylene tetrahydromethanopterin reductase-like flavin-dependent oxidoreductase (luciferase family)
VIYDVEFNSSVAYQASEVVDLAMIAEAQGFGAFWEGEANNMDPIVLLSAIAARTTTLGLGTAVYHVWGRSPATLAIQAATLNDLSGGRLLLGLGASNPRIAAWHGAEFGHPLGRVREYVDIVRGLQSGEKEQLHGTYYSSTDFKLAWKPRHPEIQMFIAALRPKMVRLAGEISRGVVVNMASPAVVRDLVEGVRAGAEQAGKDPDAAEVVVKVRCTIHPDLAVAREPLKKVLTFYSLARYYDRMIAEIGFEKEIAAIHEAYASGGFAAARAAVPDSMLDGLPLIPARSTGEVIERLQPYIEAGATRLVVTYVPATDDLLGEVRSFLLERGWGSAAAAVPSAASA